MRTKTLLCFLSATIGPLGSSACDGEPVSALGVEPRSVTGAARVAAGPHCHIELVHLSYDDPSADDEERLTLRAVGPNGKPPATLAEAGVPAADGGNDASSPHLADAASVDPCGVPSSDEPDAEMTPAGRHDAGGSSSLDASSSAGRLTLAACGLDRIELVNGSTAECPVYRTLALAEVPLPPDGYLTICSAESTLGANGQCDVTTTGGAKLTNGWIQNGSADALRFVGVSGHSQEVAYEGRACVGPEAWSLAEESAEIDDGSGQIVDDVNVWCPEGFVLQPASRIDAHQTGPCPVNDGGSDAGVSDDAAETTHASTSTQDPTGAASQRDAAADARSTTSSEPTSGSVTQSHIGTDEPVMLVADSGTQQLSQADAGPVSRPPAPSLSCTAAPHVPPGTRRFTAAALLLGTLALRRPGSRRRRRWIRLRNDRAGTVPGRFVPGRSR